MKIVILPAHPDPESFNGAIAGRVPALLCSIAHPDRREEQERGAFDHFGKLPAIITA